jgi:hypothetical protein
MDTYDHTPPVGPGPRNAAGILAELFRLYLRNLPRVSLITALVTVPLFVAGQAAFGADFFTMFLEMAEGESFEMMTPMTVRIALYLVLYAVGMIAMTGAVAEAGARRLAGSDISIARAYGISIRRLWSMVGASFVAALATGVPLLLAVLLALAVGGVAGGIVIGIAVVIITVVAVRLVFAVYVALFEQASSVAALVRSWTLVSRAVMRTLVLLLMVAVVAWLIQIIIELAAMAVPGLGAFLVALVIPPLTAIGNLLIYLDLRSRKAGYNTGHLTSELSALEGEASPQASGT